MKPVLLFLCLVVYFAPKLYAAGSDTTRISALQSTTDLLDIKARLLHEPIQPDTSRTKLRKLFIPSLTYNPSAGFELGISVAALKVFGHPENTFISNGEIEVSASTKKLAYINYKHNIYFPENRWSLQGNWQVGRTLAMDYGVGTGRRTQFPALTKGGDDVFQLKYTSFRFRETAYRKVFGDFYGGIGLILNAYTGIDEERRDDTATYHYQYSVRNGFPLWHYLANAVSFNLQFDSRDHPNRPYRGIYANVRFKRNQQFLGSTENASQLFTEFRKYWSLSATNPQHVLAFWHWGSYLLGGKLPYLELPGTSSDNDGRSGRAYTVGRLMRKR